MKKSLSLLFLLIVPLIFPQLVNAQIIINEISSGSSDEDWVEIYNNSSLTINLSDYILKDKADNEKDLIGNLAPEEFIFFGWSNRLNNNGDIVYLIKVSDGSQVDTISYGSEGGVCASDSNQSIGRYENGNVIERFKSPTKGTTNIGANILPCPTPSPSPSPTPQPISQSTMVPTPTQTSTPTPIKTLTPVPSKSPTTKPTSTPKTEPEILGESAIGGLSFTSPTPVTTSTDKPLVKDKNKTLPAIFIISGLSFIGFAVLQLINAKKTAQDFKPMGTTGNLGGNNI